MDDDGGFFFPLNPSTFNRLPGGCERHQIKVHILQYNNPDTRLTCTVPGQKYCGDVQNHSVVGDPLQKLPTDSCFFVVPHLPFTTHCPWLCLFRLHLNQISFSCDRSATFSDISLHVGKEDQHRTKAQKVNREPDWNVVSVVLTTREAVDTPPHEFQKAARSKGCRRGERGSTQPHGFRLR